MNRAIGILGRRKSGKLPHRPELAAIAGRMNAAFVWKLARKADVDPVRIGFGVEPLDRLEANALERLFAFRSFFKNGCKCLLFPALFFGIGFVECLFYLGCHKSIKLFKYKC